MQRAQQQPERRETSASVVLPWPPTVNHSWRPNGKGGKLLTEKHKQFRAVVGELVRAAGNGQPLRGRLKVLIRATPPDKRARDLDNLLKGLLDALQHAGMYADDAAIDDLHIYRAAGSQPGCAVFVEVIEGKA